MMISRRSVLFSTLAMPFVHTRAWAETVLANGGNQQKEIQAAIVAAIKTGGSVQLGAGTFEISVLTIKGNVTIQGVPGATKLVAPSGGKIFSIRSANHVVLQGLGLVAKGTTGNIVTAEGIERLIIDECDFGGAEAGIRVASCGGRVTNSRFQFHEDLAMQSIDAKGFQISGNRISDVGNCGIQVWQTERREDGSLISDNHISRVASKNGGNGQNGNGINIYKAGNVTVSDNRISDCAFTAIRNNSGPNSVITGNSISRCNEVALFVEFSHEGSVVADNLIENSAHGIKIANFDVGGRLSQVSGNVIRNVKGNDTEGLPIGGGILCDADVVVSNNVVDGAENYGIRLGWGPYGRNLLANNNLLSNCKRGIEYSTLAEGPYVISNNIISGARSGAILGMDYEKPATADLGRHGSKAPDVVSLSGNMVKS